ncbi:MAG: hypothetical protein JXO51_09740 [Candidatus Aminicenantes bacterium]|nr:hypothetical protein [Candidatus Aminicenantes bacterium]
MNYFMSNLFRDKKFLAMIGLSILAALNIADFLSFMFSGSGFFNLWVIKGTLALAVAGGIAHGVFLFRRGSKDRRLEALLPAFQAERRAGYERMAAANPEFQTFCHECRHFDLERLGCTLVLRGRKTRIKRSEDNAFGYCLYWNLEEEHPVLQLTGRLDRGKEGEPPAQGGVRPGRQQENQSQ